MPTGTTNAYLVGSERALLVDPPARTDALERLLSEADVGALVVTHTHPDHVGGVAHYAAETGATVWAHRSHTTAFEAATGVEPDRRLGEGSTLDTDAGQARPQRRC
ncbi:MAG: MBL fold metallo-hydrolase, partial [Halobacteriales archaeon]|nr:MBL fold metallo-hydrolase [Halobacteriales archaeon]